MRGPLYIEGEHDYDAANQEDPARVIEHSTTEDVGKIVRSFTGKYFACRAY